MKRKTRDDFVKEKRSTASVLPVVLAGINFEIDGNFGFLIRAAACFGASKVLLIGSVPHYRVMRKSSAGLSKHIEIVQLKNTRDFNAYCRENGYQKVALELTEDATSIFDYKFSTDKPTCITVGHETIGVPADILFTSDVVYIPMPGIGRCLNTSQAANVALYEYVKQFQQRV
jgi:tRNA G18 (ribose-2'-O)-methylase SpoU